MDLIALENCVKEAKESNAKYLAVLVNMEGFLKPEIIINSEENFDAKLAYYKKAYTEDLVLKTFSGIRIVGFTYGNDFSEIESALMF